MRHSILLLLACSTIGCSMPKGLVVNQLQAQNEASAQAFGNCIRRHVVLVNLPAPEKTTNSLGATVIRDQNAQNVMAKMGYYDVSALASSVLSPALQAQMTETSRAGVPKNKCNAEAEAYDKTKAAWMEGVDQRNLMIMGILNHRR